MTKHIKPTAEELEAAALKAAEEAEALQNKPSASPSQAAPSPSPSTVAPSPSPSPEEPSPTPDPYKKKAIEQGRENIVLNAKTKKINEAIDKASEIVDPTDEEMLVEYPEWEDMTEVEKKMAKQTLKNDRRFQFIHAARQEGKNVEAWQGKVDIFITDPKTLIENPELEGKEDEFRLFASKPTRIGVEFGDLVSAFLYDATKNMKTKKKQMFEPGSGGQNVKPKPKTDKITLEQARTLRETNYPKYIELLKAGKIDTSDLTT